MTHETKAGLFVTCTFLALVGTVLFFKMRETEGEGLAPQAGIPAEPTEMAASDRKPSQAAGDQPIKKSVPTTLGQASENKSLLTPTEMPKLQPAPNNVRLVSNNEPKIETKQPTPDAKKQREPKPEAAAQEKKPSWWDGWNKDKKDKEEKPSTTNAAVAANTTQPKEAAALAQAKVEPKAPAATSNGDKVANESKPTTPLPAFDFGSFTQQSAASADAKAKEIAEKAKADTEKLKAEADKAFANSSRGSANASVVVTEIDAKNDKSAPLGGKSKPVIATVTVTEEETGKNLVGFNFPPVQNSQTQTAPKPEQAEKNQAPLGAKKEETAKPKPAFVLPPGPAPASGFDQPTNKEPLGARTNVVVGNTAPEFPKTNNVPPPRDDLPPLGAPKPGQATRVLASGDDPSLSGRPAPDAQDRGRQSNPGFTQPPANQYAQAGIGANAQGSSDARPSFPIGATPTASTRPIVAPLPNGRPSNGTPLVESYDEETHICKAGDTFKRVSQQYYQTEKYDQALQQFNRNHPLATEILRQSSPILPAGQLLFIPPVRVLERNYASVIGASTAAVNSAPKVTEVQPVAQINQGTGRRYRVRLNGEMMRNIAQRTLGDAERWTEIYKLNMRFDPKDPVPAASELILPADARIDPGDAP